MIKSSGLRWPVICILLVAFLLAPAYGEEVLKADVEQALRISQEPQGNPFASVLKKRKQTAALRQTAALQQRATPEMREEYDIAPELFLEMVDLKYMNPQEASAAFSCMSSEQGKIVAQEGSSRVIVFDTRDNLKRIVTALKAADQPIQSLFVKAVDLQHIEAKVAASVVTELASGAGSIVVADKTNTLILCDTKTFVEAMENELKALDKPTPGLLVAAVPLKYLDAKSALTALENLLSEYGSIAVIERTNTLVISDLAKNVTLMQEEIKSIDKEMSGLIIETVSLKFLDADNLKPVLEKMVSQYGAVSSNVENNSVIICDTAENMVRILAQIRKADKTPQQIMVKVVMMDVRVGNDQEIGINWGLDYDNGFYDSLTSSAWTAQDIISDRAAVSRVLLGGEVEVANATIAHVVQLIQEKRDVEIIASPELLVMSGKTADFQAIEEIPYTLLSDFSEGGSMSTTEFKEVGITLNVTASITEQREIFLAIAIEQNARTSEAVAGIPVVDTRSESTELLLKDGEIVVMGGLRRSEKTVQVTQVPLLGDLPIVGNLFKDTIELSEISELVIVISPHIHDGGEPVPEAVTRKYEELKQKAPLTGESRAKKDKPTAGQTDEPRAKQDKPTKPEAATRKHQDLKQTAPLTSIPRTKKGRQTMTVSVVTEDSTGK